MRVVLDTNVMLAAAFTPGRVPDALLRAWRAGHFDLITSVGLLNELRDVLERPRAISRHGWSQSQREQWLAVFERDAIVLTAPATVEFPRDPADGIVLATAVAGGADCIVSGDRDLLELREYEAIPILSPAQFFAVLQDRGTTS